MLDIRSGGGKAQLKEKKDWERGFVKRRLKFVFITSTWYISPLLTLFSSRKYTEKDGDGEAVTGN